MEENMEEISQRVAKGAAFLDTKAPGWHDQIKLPTLNMSRLYDCILGQLFHGYFRGGEKLQLSDEDTQNLGFDAYDPTEQIQPVRSALRSPPLSEEYTALKAAWVTEIRKRRLLPFATRCAKKDDLHRTPEQLAALIVAQAEFITDGRGKERAVIDQALALQLPCPYEDDERTVAALKQLAAENPIPTAVQQQMAEDRAKAEASPTGTYNADEEQRP
jgi:hypothetical protein